MVKRQDVEAVSDPLRQVALHRDIKLLQAANECYCCVPSLKLASPTPSSLHVSDFTPKVRHHRLEMHR